MVNTSHKAFNGGAKALFERLQKLSSQKVAVGIPGSKNAREGSNITNSDLAYIHTNGVRPKAARDEMQPEIDKGTPYSTVLQMYIHEHGSMVYQVPPRPIIEPAIENSKKQIGKLLGDAAKDAAEGNDTERDLTDTGLYAQQEVQDWFNNPKNGWAPNAQSTIKAKGSDKPLIDTGALRDAITFEIRGDDD